MFDSDMRVRIDDARYVYPDAAATCEPAEIHELEGARSLLNPSVVFDVLSSGSEAYDRGEKFHKYRAVKSFRDYVPVHQTRPRVEVINFRDDGQFLGIQVAEGEDAVVELPSAGVSLKLSKIYRQIRFEEDASDAGEETREA